MIHSQSKSRMHREHSIVQRTKRDHCDELVWMQLCFTEKTMSPGELSLCKFGPLLSSLKDRNRFSLPKFLNAQSHCILLCVWLRKISLLIDIS